MRCCYSASLAGLLALMAVPLASQAADPKDKVLSAEELARQIDVHIEAGRKAAGVAAAPPADDAAFLRRLSLDLGGRIPRVQEIRAYLEDSSPDKRRRVVDQLLASPHHASHFANVWRVLLMPEVTANPFGASLNGQIEAWLRKRLRENVPYDRLVRELLTVPTTARRLNQQPYDASEPTAAAFYQALENKPENLAGATSRIFLGVKLECAQCHNHPFAKWTRQQFWEYAAFFGKFDADETGIPGTDRVVRARFLDGSTPPSQRESSLRDTLAGWMTRRDNVYFARAAANRLWAHFFGIGLVDPVDEESPDNPPSHPELLKELAQQLVLHDFDQKYLMKAMVLSQTYGLASQGNSPAPEPRLFARMAIKGLTPEQLYDSLAQATGLREAPTPMDPRGAVFAAPTARAEFLTRFANTTDRRTEFQTSILQALALMNGRLIADATHVDRGETLAAVLDSPFLDTPQKIETLFLTALSRKPRPEELARFVKYVETGGTQNDPRKALGDAFWALLNTAEFLLNH